MTSAPNSPNFVSLDLNQLLGGQPSGIMVPGYDSPSEMTPAFDQHFSWPSWASDLFMWIRLPAEPLFVTGPTGAGKTSAIKQLASLLRYPVYECTGHARLEMPDLIGHYVLAGDGGTVWQDGPLTAAMRHGGMFLLNEIDLIDPSTAAGLNTILDGSPLLVPETNEFVRPADGFRFVATANTVGSGDTSGLYQGTLRLNAAFMDRFAVLVADYLPEDVEKRLLLQRFPALGDGVAAVMVRLANMVRALYTGDADAKRKLKVDDVPAGMTLPLSTRSVMRWAEWFLLCRTLPAAQKEGVLAYAMMRAFGHRAEAPMQVTLHELLQRLSPANADNADSTSKDD